MAGSLLHNSGCFFSLIFVCNNRLSSIQLIGEHTMPRQIIDLSMPVHNDMMVFPRVVRPSMAMYETWQQFAERIGAAKFGVKSLTASYLIVLGDHIGTHIDSLRHLREDAPGPEGIPLEYCYGDGVCLDFRPIPKDTRISVKDCHKGPTKIK